MKIWQGAGYIPLICAPHMPAYMLRCADVKHSFGAADRASLAHCHSSPPPPSAAQPPDSKLVLPDASMVSTVLTSLLANCRVNKRRE